MESLSSPLSFRNRRNSSMGLAAAPEVSGVAVDSTGAGGGATSFTARSTFCVTISSSISAEISVSLNPCFSPKRCKLASPSALSWFPAAMMEKTRRNSAVKLVFTVASKPWSMVLRVSGLHNDSRASARKLGAASSPSRRIWASGLLGWFFSGSFFCHQTRSCRV